MAGRPNQLLALFQRHQYEALFAMLVLSIFISPVVDTTYPGSVLAAVLAAVLPLAAIVALAENPKLFYLGLALGLPASIAVVQEEVGLALVPDWVVMVCPLGIYCLATGVIVHRVVRDREVDARAMVGAVCGYLMLGYSWAIAYAVVGALQPGAFAGTDSPEGGLIFSEALYFSFVTLTTLGYGEIHPLTPQARVLVIAQAVTGVMYLAILVSSLVGTRISVRSGAGARPGRDAD